MFRSGEKSANLSLTVSPPRRARTFFFFNLSLSLSGARGAARKPKTTRVRKMFLTALSRLNIMQVDQVYYQTLHLSNSAEK